MKKLLVTVLLFAAAIAGASAQNSIEGLFNKFQGEKGADAVKVGGFFCKLAGKIAMMDEDYRNGDPEEKMAVDMLSDVNGIRVLDLSDCSENVKSHFRKSVDGLNFNGYDLLMEASDDGDKVEIYVRMNEDRINEFVLYSLEDPCIVCINGKFKTSDIEGLVACADGER